MFKDFKKLPEDIQQIILEYANIKYHHGEYASQIMKTDPRYEILQTIKRPIIDKQKLNYFNGYEYSFYMHVNDKLKIRFYFISVFENDLTYKTYNNSGYLIYTIGNQYKYVGIIKKSLSLL